MGRHTRTDTHDHKHDPLPGQHTSSSLEGGASSLKHWRWLLSQFPTAHLCILGHWLSPWRKTRQNVRCLTADPAQHTTQKVEKLGLTFLQTVPVQNYEGISTLSQLLKKSICIGNKWNWLLTTNPKATLYISDCKILWIFDSGLHRKGFLRKKSTYLSSWPCNLLYLRDYSLFCKTLKSFLGPELLVFRRTGKILMDLKIW